MKTTAETQSPKGARHTPSRPSYLNESLSPKKTAFVIVTVIGCIAILWPKVFYPMMFGGSAPKVDVKEQRVPGAVPGCCDVVLDREQFLNSTSATEIGPVLYRKHLNFFTSETSLRQERPTHLHPESIYQAMRERGRAIPATPTVPIIDRKASPSNPPPRIVEGRPGPIPGMRPPMGAGSVHQPQTKGSSMGFVMPLYTIGIVVFFVYTILKIVFKKSTPNAPYGPAPVNANFRKEVFAEDSGRPHDDLNNSKLGWREHQTIVTAIQGLIDAADEHLKISEKHLNDSEVSKESTENLCSKNGNNSEGHTKAHEAEDIKVALNNSQNDAMEKHRKNLQQQNRRDGSTDRSVEVLGIEVTASCEGGQKWIGRPPTPIFFSHNEHSDGAEMPEPQAIYLEGTLAHDAQILVADSETRTEEVYDVELNGSAEEPAVVLSSRMTLSLINLDANNSNDNNSAINKNDTESPLGDDIEIIGHDEK